MELGTVVLMMPANLRGWQEYIKQKGGYATRMVMKGDCMDICVLLRIECGVKCCMVRAIIVLTEILLQDSLGRLRHIDKLSERTKKFVMQVYETGKWVNVAWIQKVIAL